MLLKPGHKEDKKLEVCLTLEWERTYLFFIMQMAKFPRKDIKIMNDMSYKYFNYPFLILGNSNKSSDNFNIYYASSFSLSFRGKL